MTISYKKAGVDITEIKKSQRAIGKLIGSTHNLQKMAKMTHGLGIMQELLKFQVENY